MTETQASWDKFCKFIGRSESVVKALSLKTLMEELAAWEGGSKVEKIDVESHWKNLQGESPGN
jgi:hypothetical protein